MYIRKISKEIKAYLSILENNFECPIYFVLGNHDFYAGSIADVRASVKKLVQNSKRLYWMDIEGIVKLSSKTCIIGHSDGPMEDSETRNQVLISTIITLSVSSMASV